MRSVMFCVMLFGLCILGLALFDKEAREWRMIRKFTAEVAVHEMNMDRGVSCAVPETAWLMGRIGSGRCDAVHPTVGRPRRPYEVVLKKVGVNAGAGAGLGIVGLALAALVWMGAGIRRVAGEVGFRSRARSIFEKRAFAPGETTTLKIRRGLLRIPPELLGPLRSSAARHERVCRDLLRILSHYGGRDYLTWRETSEGPFLRHVYMIFAAGRRMAERQRVPVGLQGVLYICLLAQETGKLGAFFRGGAADTFGYAGPQHQSKSAGVLRSMSAFSVLPLEEQELILRLVSGHHERLLPDRCHPGAYVLREIMRSAERYRGELAEAIAGA